MGSIILKFDLKDDSLRSLLEPMIMHIYNNYGAQIKALQVDWLDMTSVGDDRPDVSIKNVSIYADLHLEKASIIEE